MSEPLRSHASVRSYYFREAVLHWLGTNLDGYSLADFRPLWRKADDKAWQWYTRWDPATYAWEQRR